MATFFTVKELEECYTLLQTIQERATEYKNIIDTVGYILAEDIYAKEDIPQGIRSCMDGYAVCSLDTTGASEHNPVYLECIGSVEVDNVSPINVEQRQCMEVVTGSILPQGTDAVVMVEYTQSLGKGTIAIGRSVTPKENCMLQGEDAKEGCIVLLKGTVIRSQEVALLATLGFSSVQVFVKPHVCIFSTGDELREVNEDINIGLVRDANSYSIEALLRSLQCKTTHLPIANDDIDVVISRLKQSLQESDIVLLSGGSSIGARDFTIKAIESIEGVEIITHGIAMQPGKPTIIATNGKQFIFGLPGQMASAYCVLLALVLPFIKYFSGDVDAFNRGLWPYNSAVLTRNIAGNAGRQTWIRVALEEKEGILYATPVLGKSGLLRTLVTTNGAIVIPSDVEGFEEGSLVKVYSL